MLSLRKVQEEDMLVIFKWANDIVVRANAFNSEPILMETHKKWFGTKLNNPNTLFLILENDGNPAGQIRYELEGNEILINYMIATEYRRKGLGSIILKMGEDFIRSHSIFKPINKLVGYVKKDNIASQKAFSKCSYLLVESNSANNPTALKYEKLLSNEN